MPPSRSDHIQMIDFIDDSDNDDSAVMIQHCPQEAATTARKETAATCRTSFLLDGDSRMSDENHSLTDTTSISSSGGSCDGVESISSLEEAATARAAAALSDEKEETTLFQSLRLTYLLVTLVIMLADGMQGTHLYVLYESYGFSVASLYCLGFATGGLLSPITGPLVDQIGRKRAALLYCGLEVFINMLEQYPFYSGLVASRMIGGFTTNLLSTVFETWLDTEYRRRGLARGKYELIMRDSVIVSNVAAIFSGYLAHVLAEQYGAVGPFRGAVTCTAVAFVVVLCAFTENYGSSSSTATSPDEEDSKDRQGVFTFLREAVLAYWNDSHMMRIGVAQGLTAGSLQIFVFLWVPALRQFASGASSSTIGLDREGEPAYGLIFGAYMAAGVFGGFFSPPLRRWMIQVVTPPHDVDAPLATVEVEGEGVVPVRPMAVELLAAVCYTLAALMLFVPFISADDSPHSFSYSLIAFLGYELIIGVFLPCEGVIRSLYFPTNARASVMTLPRVIVNVAVAVAVASTNYVSFKTAFALVGCLMLVASALQLSLVSKREWANVLSNSNGIRGKLVEGPAQRISHSFKSFAPALRRISSLSLATESQETKRKHD